MATSSRTGKDKDKSLSSQSSTAGRPPQAVKFTRRTSSGRIMSLSRDDDLDMSGEFASQNDYINYTVMMPPTPDNQPGGAAAPPSDNKPDGGGGGGEPRYRGSEGHQDNNNNNNNKRERGMSLMKSNSQSMLTRTQTQDFDHNRWLFETSGTYGVGNAYWSDEYGNENGLSMQDFMDKPWKPLTRKINVSAAVLSPYRILIVIRMICLALFLGWRVQNPNRDAMWLWGISIVCEIWFAFSWLLDILIKLNPINRSTDLAALRDKFEQPSPSNPTGRSDLPAVDVFVSTADPEKEPPLVTANTILSILAVDYPVEKLSGYISDDGGAILTFEAMAEAIRFAELWVPFCRKHNIEPRNPDSYFNLKKDPTKNKKRPDFVKDRRWIKREYDEFKVRINGLPEVIRRRSDLHNKTEARKEKQLAREKNGGVLPKEGVDVPKATWMADGTHWPGTWWSPIADHSKGDHAGILQIMSKVPESDPVLGHPDEKTLDFTGIDTRIPMFAYVSREKRPGFDHNKKAGAMNAIVRASAILSNGAFILNLDCDHYIYNSLAIREGMCFMMDRGGDRVCYIQFPQRFEGVDPSDRYANHNFVFFDGSMRALDGLQGPVYVGTGCMFRRYALYGFLPPRANEYAGVFGQVKSKAPKMHTQSDDDSETQPLTSHPDLDLPKMFGNSSLFNESIAVTEYQGRPLADHVSVKNGRPPGALLIPRPPLDAPTVAEAVAVISCWYEDKTEWGEKIGWIYGSVTEDVVTGYRMHNRGWRSVYCITKRDAFRGTAPINLTDRLHQVLRWATGSVEIFFSKNNPLLASRRLKFLQRIAYLNVGIYPFTSIFLVAYCYLPALSLISGQFIVSSLNVYFLSYLLIISVTLTLLSLLEVKWSGIGLEEWWRNEQFWVIGGTSAHFIAVCQGLLKVIAGVEISFKLTSKSAGEDEDDQFADLYLVKWTSLFIMPLAIITVNLVALVIGISRTIYSVLPQWNKLLGGSFFSLWVLTHMYPFVKGLLGRRGKVPTIVYVWAGLISITMSLLMVAIDPPTDSSSSGGGVQCEPWAVIVFCHTLIAKPTYSDGSSDEVLIFAELVDFGWKEFDINRWIILKSDVSEISYGCGYCPSEIAYPHPSRDKYYSPDPYGPPDPVLGTYVAGGCDYPPQDGLSQEELAEKFKILVQSKQLPLNRSQIYFTRCRSRTDRSSFSPVLPDDEYAEIALLYINEEEGAQFELVKTLGCCRQSILMTDSRDWCHVCFIAKNKNGDADASMVHFFAELYDPGVKKFSLSTYAIVDPSGESRKGCGICPDDEGYLHPADDSYEAGKFSPIYGGFN